MTVLAIAAAWAALAWAVWAVIRGGGARERQEREDWERFQEGMRRIDREEQA